MGGGLLFEGRGRTITDDPPPPHPPYHSRSAAHYVRQHGHGLLATESGGFFLPLAPHRAPYPAAQAEGMYCDGLEHGGSLAMKSRADSTLAQRRLVEQELLLHLARLPAAWGVNVMTAQPTDVVVFVSQVWIPRHGRTRLSTGAMYPAASNLRGMFPALAHIFDRQGRGGEWSLSLPYNNPCRSSLVEDMRQGLERYILAHAPAPVAAVELTETKLLVLVVDLDRRHAAHALDHGRLKSAYQRMQCVILARDALLFVYLFHSLQRGAEGAAIGLRNLSFPADPAPLVPADPRLLTAACLRVQTGRQKCSPTGSVLEIPRADDARLCFMRRLHAFYGTCARLGVPLGEHDRPFFRPSATNNRGAFADHPLSSSAGLARLKQALAKADVDEGETLHSCRRGGIQREKRKGVPAHETMERANIKTPKIYALYADAERATRRKPKTPGMSLAEAPEPPPRGCAIQ